MNSYNTPNIIPVGAVLNTTINSLAMQLNEMVNFSVQIVFTGTPTGSFKLQASDDPVPKQTMTPGANGVVTFTPVHWSDIANSSFTVTAAGDVMWDYNNRGFTYVRAVYTDTSSGSSTAVIASAVFNAVGA